MIFQIVKTEKITNSTPGLLKNDRSVLFKKSAE